MVTAFFIVCKIYFRLVLSKLWIRREYYFESRNCDVHLRSAKNVIRNRYCDLWSAFLSSDLARCTQNENTAYSG